MPDVVHAYIHMFADDTKLYRAVNTPEDTEALQTDLSKLEQWANQWQLRFNAEKCKVMHLGTNNAKYAYTMQKEGKAVELETTELEKDLGVYIDPGLTFSAHCEQKVNKANKLLGLIRRSYAYLDSDTVKSLYTSLVRPHIEYGNTAWTPRYKKDMELIENVQRRATKLAPTLKDLPYHDRLHALDLPSLYYRRARGDMIETYKHLTGKYSVDADYLRLDDTNTRGHRYKLKKERTNKSVRQQFYSYRIVNAWNGLPSEVVEAPSLNAFKARLDKHWRQYRYCKHPVFDAYNPLNLSWTGLDLIQAYSLTIISSG